MWRWNTICIWKHLPAYFRMFAAIWASEISAEYNIIYSVQCTVCTHLAMYLCRIMICWYGMRTIIVSQACYITKWHEIVSCTYIMTRFVCVVLPFGHLFIYVSFTRSTIDTISCDHICYTYAHTLTHTMNTI